MAANDPHFKIRMPRDLKQMLEEVAEEAGRSLTAEIVHRLRHSFDTSLDLMVVHRALELKQASRDVASARMQLEDAVDDPDSTEELIALRKANLEIYLDIYRRIKAGMEKISEETERAIVWEADSASKPMAERKKKW